MYPVRVSQSIAVAVLCMALMCAAAPSFARGGVLPDVHGYNTGSGVVVPLRGVAEWMGATVDFRNPRIRITLGSREVGMKLGSKTATVNGKTIKMTAAAKQYGNITCVPLRAAAKALGASVEYYHKGVPEIPNLSVISLAAQGRTARIIVHQAPPDMTARVISLYWDEYQMRHGEDTVVLVERMTPRSGAAYRHDWDGQTGSFSLSQRGDALEFYEGQWEWGAW